MDLHDWRFSGLDWMVAAVIAAEVLLAVFVWGHGPLAPIPMGGAGHLVRWGDRTEAAFLLGRAAIFAALVYLTVRRGVTDPVCGMQVDRDKAVTLERDGRTHYFCSEHCRHRFEAGGSHHVG